MYNTRQREEEAQRSGRSRIPPTHEADVDDASTGNGCWATDAIVRTVPLEMPSVHPPSPSDKVAEGSAEESTIDYFDGK